MNLLLALLFLFHYDYSATQHTAESYITKNKTKAIELMHQSGVPASVILGVAMHESANGNSRIARKLRNHFGLKGKRYSRKHQSRYQPFLHQHRSYEEFVHLLQKKKQLHSLFEKHPKKFAIWLRAIQHSSYANSKRWCRQVTDIIKKHELYRYDQIKWEEVKDEIDIDTLADAIPMSGFSSSADGGFGHSIPVTNKIHSNETTMQSLDTEGHETCEARMKTIENKPVLNKEVRGSISPLNNKLFSDEIDELNKDTIINTITQARKFRKYLKFHPKIHKHRYSRRNINKQRKKRLKRRKHHKHRTKRKRN